MESTHPKWIEWRYYLRQRNRCYFWSIVFLATTIAYFFVDFGSTPAFIKIMIPISHAGTSIWMFWMGRKYANEMKEIW